MRIWKPEDTPNFQRHELECSCGCGKSDMDGDFMEKLQHMRQLLGRPISLSSGFRCADHEEERNKTQPGAHAAGLAADIEVSNGHERFKVIEAAIHVGMKGIGVANSFVHVDDGHPYAHRPASWKY